MCSHISNLNATPGSVTHSGIASHYIGATVRIYSVLVPENPSYTFGPGLTSKRGPKTNESLMRVSLCAVKSSSYVEKD